LDQFETVTDASKPSWEYDTTDYDVSWFIDASWMLWPTNGADLVSRTIYQKTGCKIKFRVATDEESTELSTLISSDDLPDVVTVKASSIYTNQLPDQGYVWSMDQLMSRFAPSMVKRYKEEQKDIYNWFQQDGQLYGIPNLSYSDYYTGDNKLSPNGAILVREDWYNEVVTQLGEDMTTKESFLKGVEYITSKYNDAIGVQLDPFTSTGNLSATWLAQYFAVPYEKTDGTYNHQILDEKYKEVITFLNTLAVEGYIHEANFTTNTAGVNTNIARGKVFVSMVTPQNYNNAFASLPDKNINYIPLVLRNDAGDAPVLQDLRGKGYMFSFITKDCDRPDKVIKLFDYMTSEEGQLLINFGVEGDTFVWDEKHERIEWTQKYIDDYDNNNLAQYGFGYCNALLNQSFYDKVAPVGTTCKTDASMYIEDLKAPLKPYSYDYTPSFLLPDTTSSQYFDYIEQLNLINSYWGMYLPQMIAAKNNEEALKVYNKTVQSMKSNGLDFVVSFMANGYQASKKALGVEVGWPAYQDGYTAPTTGANGDFSYYKYKN
jgi:putative aldouronate transport system substrate-binding protein